MDELIRLLLSLPILSTDDPNWSTLLSQTRKAQLSQKTKRPISYPDGHKPYLRYLKQYDDKADTIKNAIQQLMTAGGYFDFLMRRQGKQLGSNEQLDLVRYLLPNNKRLLLKLQRRLIRVVEFDNTMPINPSYCMISNAVDMALDAIRDSSKPSTPTDITQKTIALYHDADEKSLFQIYRMTSLLYVAVKDNPKYAKQANELMILMDCCAASNQPTNVVLSQFRDQFLRSKVSLESAVNSDENLKQQLRALDQYSNGLYEISRQKSAKRVTLDDISRVASKLPSVDLPRETLETILNFIIRNPKGPFPDTPEYKLYQEYVQAFTAIEQELTLVIKDFSSLSSYFAYIIKRSGGEYSQDLVLPAIASTLLPNDPVILRDLHARLDIISYFRPTSNLTMLSEALRMAIDIKLSPPDEPKEHKEIVELAELVLQRSGQDGQSPVDKASIENHILALSVTDTEKESVTNQANEEVLLRRMKFLYSINGEWELYQLKSQFDFLEETIQTHIKTVLKSAYPDLFKQLQMSANTNKRTLDKEIFDQIQSNGSFLHDAKELQSCLDALRATAALRGCFDKRKSTADVISTVLTALSNHRATLEKVAAGVPICQPFVSRIELLSKPFTHDAAILQQACQQYQHDLSQLILRRSMKLRDLSFEHTLDNPVTVDAVIAGVKQDKRCGKSLKLLIDKYECMKSINDATPAKQPGIAYEHIRKQFFANQALLRTNVDSIGRRFLNAIGKVFHIDALLSQSEKAKRVFIEGMKQTLFAHTQLIHQQFDVTAKKFRY